MATQYQTNQNFNSYQYGQNGGVMMKSEVSSNYCSDQFQQLDQTTTTLIRGPSITASSVQSQIGVKCSESDSNTIQAQYNSFYDKQHSAQQCSINSADTLSSSLSFAGINNHHMYKKGSELKEEEKRRGSESTQSDQMEEDEEMGVNYEDYTTFSHQYPEHDEELEKIEEEENQRVIERCNQQQSFIFSMEANENNPLQFNYIPINKIINEMSECYLYGDIILEPRYSSVDEKAVNSFCNWKYVNEAVRRPNFVKINANNKSGACENFNQVVQHLNSFQNKDIYRLSNLVENFGKMYQFIKQGLKQTADYIEIFEKFQILLKRQKIFDELSDQYLQSIPSDKIFFAVKIQNNFSALQIEASHICFSNNLLKLVNVQEDKFINLILRNKAPEFFGWQLRLMFLRNKLCRYLRIDEAAIEEADILTRDGLRIPTKVKKEVIKFDIDSLVPELPLNPFQESISVYYFEIDQNTINQIEFMRKNYSIDELNNPEEVDFYTYSLETQAFLELYYSSINPSISQQKKKSNKKPSNNTETNSQNN